MVPETRSTLVEFWRQRAPRERWMLALAGLVVASGVFYALVLEPMLQARARLDKGLPQLRAELRLMRAQVGEIERLNKTGAVSIQGGGSLLGRIGALADAQGLRDRLRTLQALDEGRAQATAESVPLRAWLAWIEALQGQGVRVEQGRITPLGAGDDVAAEALLAGGRP